MSLESKFPIDLVAPCRLDHCSEAMSREAATLGFCLKGSAGSALVCQSSSKEGQNRGENMMGNHVDKRPSFLSTEMKFSALN